MASGQALERQAVQVRAPDPHRDTWTEFRRPPHDVPVPHPRRTGLLAGTVLDPDALAARVNATRKAQVLDGQAETVEGLRIYGMARPVFTENQGQDVDTDEFQARARIVRDVETLDDPPDVVAVHDDRMAEALAGRVPVVLAGHYHRARAATVNGTLYLRAGSTGGPV